LTNLMRMGRRWKQALQSLKEVGPTESHDSDMQGKMLKDLTTDILNGICDNKIVSLEDDGLFMMLPLFSCLISKEML